MKIRRKTTKSSISRPTADSGYSIWPTNRRFLSGKNPRSDQSQTSPKQQKNRVGKKSLAGGCFTFYAIAQWKFSKSWKRQKEIGQFQKEISILERKNVRVRERRTHAKGRLNAGSKEGKKRGRKGRSVAIRQGILGGLLLFAFWTALEGDF